MPHMPLLPRRDRSAAHLLGHAASTPAFSNSGLNVAFEYHEPGPPSFPWQFTVRSLLPPSHGFECCAKSGCGACPGSPVATQCADQCCVNRAYLNSDNPSANRLPSTNLRQIQVSDHHFGGPSRQMRATATSTAKPRRP